MITVRVLEGLGNQMFHYAYARSLAHRGFDVQIDSSLFVKLNRHTGYELNKYHITLPDLYNRDDYSHNEDNFNYFCQKHNELNCQVIIEPSLEFSPDFFRPPQDCYIIGDFQDETYFSYIRDILLDEFRLKVPLSEYGKQIEQQILQTQNSISMHFRLGDYVSEQFKNTHGFVGVEYYNSAISFIESRIENPTYFIFSNDIQWCKENVLPNKSEANIVFVDSPEPRIPQEDIHLMSLCQHHIIANSTFSWWGAWLCRNPTQIAIAPRQWFADPALQAQSGGIACKHWIKL